MKKLVVIFAVSGLLMSCNSRKNENAVTTAIDSTSKIIDDTKNVVPENEGLGEVSLYEGVLPCADCSGIKTVLKIYFGDGTIESHQFELSSIYQGKDEEKVFVQKGNYNTERGLGNDPDGTIYVLNYDKPEGEQIFYGYTAASRDKLFLLNDKREISKSKLNYFLTLKK